PAPSAYFGGRMSRIYLCLLRLYPRSFRDEYGPAMLQLFQDRMREENCWRGWRGGVSEVFSSLPLEHWRTHARELRNTGAILVVVSFSFWMVFARGQQFAYAPLVDVPPAVGDWARLYDIPIVESTFEALGTSDILNRVYTMKRQQVSLLVARWRSNRFLK